MSGVPFRNVCWREGGRRRDLLPTVSEPEELNFVRRREAPDGEGKRTGKRTFFEVQPRM